MTSLHYLSSPRCISRCRRYTLLEATLQWTSIPTWGRGRGSNTPWFYILQQRGEKTGSPWLVWPEKNSLHFATPPLVSKWRLKNERRNSILKKQHYPDLGNASDWSCHVGNLLQPIRSHYPDLGSDASSIWNFCARFSDVISRKPAVASRNVGCFFRLWLMRTKIFQPAKVWTSRGIITVYYM